MKNFPKITTNIPFEHSLEITKSYLMRLRDINDILPGGDFEAGGVVWELPMPFNFTTTFFGKSLCRGLFEVDRPKIEAVKVYLNYGVRPQISICRDNNVVAKISLVGEKLNFVVVEDPGDNETLLNSGSC